LQSITSATVFVDALSLLLAMLLFTLLPLLLPLLNCSFRFVSLLCLLVR
jgi:hypothetical protein